MTKKILTLILALAASQFAAAQSDDFGYDLSIEGETKLARGLHLGLEAGMRTQDDAKKIDRYTVGAALDYRLYQSPNKKLTIKANAGFDYLWTNKLQDKEMKYFEETDGLVDDGYFNTGDVKGYNITDQYWRDRYRINSGLSASYTLNKRWSFSIKETVQHSHYCDATANRTKYRVDENQSYFDDNGDIVWVTTNYGYTTDYTGDDNLDENGNVIGKFVNQGDVFKKHKDKTILRSKFQIEYNIKGIPIDIFASVDYGCGLNYSTNKWKYTAGYDYKINKTNKLTVFYRYNTEDDDDEANGHLVGLGYKIEF